MENTLLIVVILLIVAAGGVAVYYIFKQTASTQPIHVNVTVPTNQMRQQEQPRISIMEPTRSLYSPPDLLNTTHIPFNQATRGIPETYQQIGILTAPSSGGSGSSGSRSIIPLFGRKLMTNRDRWNYYTRTDGFNTVSIPVAHKNRSCDEDIGCEEIYDGDSISTPALGQTYVATIYKTNSPNYLPIV